ncbi:MAG: GNAT family N-acetyltransferase [Oceanospirillaceae bacterium]|nr:GNAT family N-acetyltransferase [Oceanospirillaceae bacterium]
MTKIAIQPVSTADLESLVLLRIKAMQPSLEALGRFDPQRARARFVQGFDASNTYKILVENSLAGFYVLIDREDHLWLDHLYIAANYQGMGLGGQVMANLQEIAVNANLPLRLGALKKSRANTFYRSQGFATIAEIEWDNIYQWSPASDSSCNESRQ